VIEREQTQDVLTCVAVTEDATGWKAMLAVGNEDAEDVEEVAVYCSECAAREFDD
jgi:hypothetical protein